MTVEVCCPVCHNNEETVLYALTSCSAAEVAWFASPLGIRSTRISVGSFYSWFEALLRDLDSDQLCMAAMVVWSIWNSRNNVIHGEGATNVLDGLASSLRLLSEFQKARGFVRSVQPLVIERTNRWTRPPMGVLKVNCDAAVKRKGFVGVGFIVRDWQGNVIGLGLDRIMGNVGVLCAEALAVRGGLMFALEGHVDRLIVESDCKRIIDMLNNQGVDEASYVHDIIQECRLLSTRIREVSFQFVVHQCNRVAHCIAGRSQSASVKAPSFWLGVIPPFISHLVVEDNSF